MSIPAVVLCGGLGTRLRSVVQDRPKAMAEVRGRPFLTYLLDQLAEAGVSDIVLATGYMGDQVSEVLGEDYRGVSLHYSRESSPLGTGGALRMAARSCPVAMVLNGDSYCDVDLAAFIEWHFDNGNRNSMIVTQVDDVRQFGSVQVDPAGNITAFEEKCPGLGVAAPGLINAGIYIVCDKLIESIPDGRPVSLEREVFPRWLDGQFRVFPSKGGFIDIGTPISFAAAGEHVGGNGNLGALEGQHPR
jgi:D-glycero-alpha-D-manno-heptose 1-phosphate guanylyltransferase